MRNKENYFIINNFKSKKLVTQLFIVILGFSAILIAVVSFVVGHQTNKTFTANTNQLYNNALEASSQTMSALLSGYHDSLTHITYDTCIIDFIVTPNAEDSVANYQVWSALDGYCQENEAIEEIYLYVKKTDQVLTSSYETALLEEFPENEILRQHFNIKPTTAILKSGRISSIEIYQNSLYMIRDFPLNGEKKLGTLFMKIKPAALYQSLSGSQTSYSQLLAYDNEWNPLFPELTDYPILPGALTEHTPNMTYTDGCHYFYSSSKDSYIRLVLKIDSRYLSPPFQAIIRNLIPFFILILILNSLLSTILLYLSYLPIQKLTKIVSAEKAPKPDIETNNEWDYLANHFLSISNQKHQLDEIFTSMLPKISTEFYFELLNGKPMQPDYIDNILSNIGSPLKLEGTFGLVAITFHDDIDKSRRTEILELLTKYLDECSSGFLHYVLQQIDYSLYAMILQFAPSLSAPEITGLEIRLEQIFNKGIKENNALIFMELGPKCEDIQNLSVSYLETLRRLTERKYTRQHSHTEQISEKTDLITPDYRYFQTQTKVILKFIMNGETSCACRKALELCDMISANKTMEEVCKAFEYYRLAFIDTLKKYNLNGSPEEFSFLPEQPDSLQMNQYMKRFCTSAVEHLTEKYRKQQHKYLVKAKEYVEKNFNNPNLSLNLLADKCETTASYLSRLFKESFGINFVDYLNQYRIEQAKVLLKDSDETVKNIARLTGFNSQQNFIRVFKKYTGLTPGQYKSE